MTSPALPGGPGDPAAAPAGSRPVVSAEEVPQHATKAPAPGLPLSGPQGREQEFARFYREHIGRLVTYLAYQGALSMWPPSSLRTP
jgi:hypothetical protein